MKNFDTRVYSIGDFLEWDANGRLELDPDFQRRGVWTKQAKSYLIDTILSGKPMPKILMEQKLAGSRNTRVIIDGQQRLRAIIEFHRGEYTISKTHNSEFGNCIFDGLPKNIQNEFLKYELGVDVIFDLSYEETLDIFARLNTYSVRLNKQELFNAKYVGPFKQYAYKIGYSYVTYWIESGVMTKAKVTRMGEAELASDLLFVSIDGVQTNKHIEKIYKNYDDEECESKVEKAAENARVALDLIMKIYPPDDLKVTNFKRVHVFYSLFCAVYHHLFGISDIKVKRNRNMRKRIGQARVILDNFSALYDEEAPSLQKFIDASRRATTDTGNRKFRANILADLLAQV